MGPTFHLSEFHHKQRPSKASISSVGLTPPRVNRVGPQVGHPRQATLVGLLLKPQGGIYVGINCTQLAVKRKQQGRTIPKSTD